MTPRKGVLFAGKYEIIGPIGRGGMATVLLALKYGYDGVAKPIALKTTPDLVGASPHQRAAILNEARIACQLSHSNIVQMLDIGESNGVIYLELERVDGVDLAQLLSDMRESHERVEIGTAVYIIGEILEGLRYAHEFERDGCFMGVMHRDLTPSNIIISSAGEVKITDFGIAKTIHDITSQQYIKGKLRYMAPEQAGGESSPQCDLFGVGAILYELLEGRVFRDDVAGDLRLAVAGGAVPALTRSDVPPELVAFYESLVAKRRADRFTTASEAIAQLAAPGLAAMRGLPAHLRALYAEQVGERPHSGYTFDRELPAPLRALFAALDAGTLAAAPVAEPDAPVTSRRAPPPAMRPPLDGSTVDVPRPHERRPVAAPIVCTEHLGREPQKAARTPPTEILANPSVGRAPSPEGDRSSSVVQATASAAARASGTNAAPRDPGTAFLVETRIAWRRPALLAAALLAIGVLVGVMLLREGPAPTRGHEPTAIAPTERVVEPAPAAEPPAAEPTLDPIPSSDATQPGPRELSPSAGSVVVVDPVVPTAAPPAVSPAAAPVPTPPTEPSTVEPSQRATKRAPAKQPVAKVPIRFTPMGAEGELRVGGKIVPVTKTLDTTIRVGRHTLEWRTTPGSAWTETSPLQVDKGRDYIVRLGPKGPRVASIPAGAPP